MLKHNEVNPLAVFGLRRMDHCPPHFTVVTFEIYAPEKTISDWIWENLDGRFYLGDEYSTDADTKSVRLQKRVGFEIPGEASYFSLVLDTINKSIW